MAQECGMHVDKWDEWTVKLKAKHANGNGHGNSLAVEVQRVARGDLLPTPVGTDAVGARNSTCVRANQDTTKINLGDTLTDALWKLAAERGEMELPGGEKLMPTPQVSDGERNHAAVVGGKRPSGQKRSIDLNTVTADLASKRGKTGPLLPTPTTQDGANNAGPSQFRRNTIPLNAEVTLLSTPTAGNGGQTSRGHDRIGELLLGGQVKEIEAMSNWGKYSAAIARWEAVTRPAPEPTEPNAKGNPRLAAPFSEWMLGWPSGWCTDPAIGISRNDQLRIVGNGVVPQQAQAAIRYLLTFVATEVA